MIGTVEFDDDDAACVALDSGPRVRISKEMLRLKGLQSGDRVQVETELMQDADASPMWCDGVRVYRKRLAVVFIQRCAAETEAAPLSQAKEGSEGHA